MEGIERFIEVQDSPYSGYTQALNEMENGGKCSHWIWYIFPQIAGLGRSGMAQRYALTDIEEAKAYLEHPILGKRLYEITNVVLSYPEDEKPRFFMGSSIDAIKLKSSMTLFDIISPNDIFGKVLDKFYSGERDHKTIAIVQHSF